MPYGNKTVCTFVYAFITNFHGLNNLDLRNNNLDLRKSQTQAIS